MHITATDVIILTLKQLLIFIAVVSYPCQNRYYILSWWFPSHSGIYFKLFKLSVAQFQPKYCRNALHI